MRILGIDYGTVRTGVAMSDPLGMLAHPLEAIKISYMKDLIDAIAALSMKNGVEKIIIGLPKHMNGDESDSSKKVRELASELEKKLNIPILLYDERLTTSAAEKLLIETDMSRKKRKEKIDSLAASIILQGYLDSMPITGVE
ncbi:MAG: Holliday junction DNA helicase RuvA [Lentisphaerae bacterium GWF2_44_16]|nr:MAG: Holliday junction DNA helicase RuvA [Lentisphaerae bacterium GWF2_44_16]